MNARVTQGLALLLAKVMGVTGRQRIGSHGYFFLRFLSAIHLSLWDYQWFEGQKLRPYTSIATVPSCNRSERQVLGSCSLLLFARHQHSRSRGSSGCHAFSRAQSPRFTSPGRSNGTHECVGCRSSADGLTQHVFGGSHTLSLEPLAGVCLWVPKDGDHSVHVRPPKDMLSLLSLKENQQTLPQILDTLNSSERLAQSHQSFLPHESQAGSYKCSKDFTLQRQPVHTGLHISLPRARFLFELETGALHLWLPL